MTNFYTYWLKNSGVIGFVGLTGFGSTPLIEIKEKFRTLKVNNKVKQSDEASFLIFIDYPPLIFYLYVA